MADEPEILEEETPEEGRPEWLPENFKSPADLVKSYHEAQGRISQLSESQKELEETMQALLESQQTPAEPTPAYSDDQLTEAYNNDPVRFTLWAAQQAVAAQQAPPADPRLAATEEISAELADNALRAKYDDWGTVEQPGYNQKVAQLIHSDKTLLPDDILLSPAGLTKRLEQLYKMAKADDLISGNTQIQEQADALRQAKLQAQTVSGAAGRPEATGESDEDFAKSLIAAADHSYAARMARAGR